MIKHWDKPSREVVESSPSEMFSSPLGTVLPTLLQLTLLSQGGMRWLTEVSSHFIYPGWFCGLVPYSEDGTSSESEFQCCWRASKDGRDGMHRWRANFEKELVYWHEDICIHPQRNFSNFFFFFGISKNSCINERSLSRQKVGKRSKGWVQWDEWWLHKSWQLQLFPNIMALSVHCEIRSAF